MPMFSVVTVEGNDDGYVPKIHGYAMSRADLARFSDVIGNGAALVFRGKPIKVSFVEPRAAVRVVLGEPKAPKEKKERKSRAPKFRPTPEPSTTEPAPFQGGSNATDEPPAKKKGGWPKGKPRKARTVEQETTANGAE